ncbi:DAK2 domain-containing protein [Petroclostridium sp. X23]|uniref:DAK2 domain-containing protein n=1 Tax=Petroclostridium sp. X23 TaxID=3045146 RepID=UPI0024AE1758|nr:DAK2 domain-containing protein [Petroclostridium sp. X23]WHH59887.1 DAK2 domain-containing protein [Petroclostridium sp. X23]
MLILKHIDGKTLKRMIVSAANNLENNKKAVDELNVFPVPDGDTGTNMSLTLLTASKEVKQKDDNNVSVIADVLASASLRGARGNSGVILSQLFRGFAKELKDRGSMDAKAFAFAMQAGVDTAYKAVMKPTEGTILTVAREGAKRAIEASEKNDDIIEVFEAAIAHANHILDQTPEMLPVLKKAGVVDAGGKGLIVILEGALYALKTENEIEQSENQSVIVEQKSNAAVLEDIQFAYCTEFLIQKKDGTLGGDLLKSKIECLGDSMLVIDDEDVIKVHIHTNNPGTVIEESLKLGELVNIKIDNMKEQHRHNVSYGQEKIENKPYGFITVAMGEGLKNIFVDLGIDKVIEGGQTMNPSTEDILKAIDEVHADHIFILPNNKNIILAAEQAKTLTDKNIIVVPSKSIPQGIAAMLAFNMEADAQKNSQDMAAALESVKTGQVTYAVRNSSFDDQEIIQGDILGIQDGKIEIAGKNVSEVSCQLLHLLVDEESSVISIFYGDDIDEDQVQELSEYAEEQFPDCDVEVHNGGQPLYYYVISVE